MNKITKLLVAFVAVTSFSLTSCEPDYVTDGSTVPSETTFTVSYLDSNNNVSDTETYSFDKKNGQVIGQRTSIQDTEGNYTSSLISVVEKVEEGQAPGVGLNMFFEYNEEQNTYEFNTTGRNTATFSFNANNTYKAYDGEITVFSYDIIPGSTVADIYFRSRSEFHFYAKNQNSNQKILVEGKITTNTKF